MPYHVRGRVLWGPGLLILGASAFGSAGACGGSNGGGALGAGGDAGDVVTCKLEKDCPDGLHCDRVAGQCVECLETDDCSSDESCVAGVCRAGCQSDKDCRALNQLCGDDDVCVDCLTDSHCEDGETCSDDGVCQSSSGEGGSGTGGSNTGGTDTGGKNTGGTETGGTEAGGSGGGGQGGTTEGGSAGRGGMAGQGGSGGLPGCVNEPINPCATMPHFTGTQTLDGSDADFCDVPPFTLSLATTPYYRGTQPPLNLTTGATVRAAWSAAAFHIFVRVVDATPYPSPSSSLLNIWNGDNIEFFASPNSPSGSFNYLRSADYGAFQVIAAMPGTAYFPSGQAAFASTGAATAVPALQIHLATTANGYTVEAQIPWTEAAPIANTAMGFDMGISDDVDGVYNASSEYRNYYGLLYNAASSGGVCTLHYEPYCNSLNWCKPIAAP
jgi:hypothetical protein